MRTIRAALLTIAALALASTGARDASACGGYYIPGDDIMQQEISRATGHRMALSISKTETTLWDEITYDGSPSSFAWVLPIKGTVEVGLSSDALFAELAAKTQVSLRATYGCPGTQCGGGDDAPASGTSGDYVGGMALDGEETPVEVTAQAVVGPYEMVQLSSKDPGALTDWLTAHGFAVAPDVTPILAAYVAEGFDFLALKLLPDKGVAAMRPVRVTSQGANPVLPLRMVAAGTGETTAITLWVLGEGRYEPTGSPTFQIDPDALVWDWDSSSSNYPALREAGFQASQGKGWLLEAAEPTSSFVLADELTKLAESDPVKSGYADDQGMGAPAACAADLAALLGAIDPNTLWVTRMSAELPREALAADLDLGASADQTYVPRVFYIQDQVGEPICPPPPDCPGPGSGGPGSGPGPGAGAGAGEPGADDTDGGGADPGGCAVGGGADSSAVLTALGLSLGIALARRRNRLTNPKP